MFLINKVCLSNFKNYKELTIFEFSSYSEITGQNSKGKTTIAEAITWALYGCDLLGDQKSDSKLINKDSTEMFVILDYEIDGICNRIVRKKTSSSLTLKLNDMKVSEKELSSNLPNKDLFLAIFNPCTFLSLTVTKQRNLLMKMLPPINPNDIIKKYNYVNDNIEDLLMKYPSINDGIKKLSSQIESIKNNILFKENEISVFQNLICDNTKDNEIIEEFNESDEKLLVKLQSKLLNNNNETLLPIDNIKSEISMIDSLLSIEKNKVFVSSNKEFIDELKFSLAKLSGEQLCITELIQKINELGSVCSVCGQPLSDEKKYTELYSLTNKLVQIEQQANSLNESIDILTNLDDSQLYDFESNKNEVISELEERKIILSQELVRANESNRLLKECAINRDIEIQINSLKDKQRTYLDFKANLLNQKKSLDSYNDKIKKLSCEIEKQKVDLKNIDIKYHALKGYASLYTQYIGEILSTWLDKVSIDLFKTVVSTGEIKDTFDIKYDNKALRLISKSEYIKVGLELSNMFNNALGINIPIFVDDAESILNLPKLSTQMIVSRVKDCDLQIENPDNILNYSSDYDDASSQ